jgi:hypothetical protein
MYLPKYVYVYIYIYIYIYIYTCLHIYINISMTALQQGSKSSFCFMPTMFLSMYVFVCVFMSANARLCMVVFALKRSILSFQRHLCVCVRYMYIYIYIYIYMYMYMYMYIY